MAGVLLAGVAVPSNAKDFANFDCSAGDINYAVSMAEFLTPYVVVKVTVSELMDQKLNRVFALNMAKKTYGTTMAYTGIDMHDGVVTFSASSPETVRLRFADGNSFRCVDSDAGTANNGYNPDGTSSTVGTTVSSLDRAALEAQMRQLTRMDAAGYSLGGRMRDKPNKGYNAVARIRDGNQVQIIGRTAMVDDGYTWYKVRTDAGRTGYMWGGELCYAYERLDGLYGSCRSQGVDVPNMWMVIAVDRLKGKGKSGVAIEQAEARRKAIRRCGGSNCQVVDEGQPRCHAYAASRKAGYFDGSAQGQSLSTVRRRAKEICETTAAIKGTCKIKFATCQEY